MRRQKWGVIGLAAMLGITALGCGEKKTEQDNGTDNPATVINWQEETKDTPDVVQGQETLPLELQKLEKWELSDLYEQGALSEAESVRNSNLLNEGRFAFDENGQIYFSLPDTSVIYTSGKKGENLRVFKDNPGWYMQYMDGWLYYNAERESLRRVNCESGEEEPVAEDVRAEYFITEDGLYAGAADGVGVFDGSGVKVWDSAPGETVRLMMGNGIITGSYLGDSAENFGKGYLIAYRLQDAGCGYIRKDAMYTLWAGKWFSYANDDNSMDTLTRHVYNLESGEDFDLGSCSYYAVSDGEALYYWDSRSDGTSVYKWKETEKQEICFLEGSDAAVTHMFLGQDMLYWIFRTYSQDGAKQTLYYYDLATDEMGMVYEQE